MDRNPLSGQMLTICGILLSMVAIIHFPSAPLALRPVSSQSSTEEFGQIGPLFLLSFIAVGMRLLSVGLSLAYCAGSIRRGQGWARTICSFR